MNNTLTCVRRLYGEQDLSSWQLFSGKYINFGFWADFTRDQKKKISINERTQSSENLYQKVGNAIDIQSTDYVLEVGCGLGVRSHI